MKQDIRHRDNKVPRHSVIKCKLLLWQTVSAVLSAFFGVRKQIAQQHDFAKLNPIHIIIIGIMLGILFVLFLLCMVHLALNYA
jgi:hypothetical protein